MGGILGAAATKTLLALGTKAGTAAKAGAAVSKGVSIGTGVAGATAVIGSGFALSNAAKSQAEQARLAVQAERTQAEVRNAERQRQLRRVLAAQSAAFGQAGISLSSGTPLTLAEASIAEAEKQGFQDFAFSQAQQSQLGLQASNFLGQSNLGLFGGLIGGGQSLINLGGVPNVVTGGN